MTDIEIEEDFWTHKYFEYFEQEKRIPDVHEFDTDEIDDEIEKWAKEDAEFLNSMKALNNPDEWEPVNTEQVEFFNG